MRIGPVMYFTMTIGAKRNRIGYRIRPTLGQLLNVMQFKIRQAIRALKRSGFSRSPRKLHRLAARPMP